MKRLLLVCVVAFLAAYFVPASVVAQTQFATISGIVTDEQGLAVPDASVTVTSVATGTKQVSTTNKDGLYVVANVLAGEYDISVEKQGFQKTVKRVTVGVAQALTSNFTLKIGQITQTLTVTESAVTINTESGELGTQITDTQLRSLPLLTRNPYDLIALAAGAADTGQVTGDTRGGNQATGEGLGISVNGQRTSDINFLLDGGENNDTFVAGVAELVPLESVQEFKIQTNDMSAAYGRNPVNVNVITKSGTNNLHATAWEYYRGAGLSSTPFFNNAFGRNPDGSPVSPKSNFVRNDFGFVAGGPIRKEKTFAFGSFEGLRVRGHTATPFFVPTGNFLSNASAAAQNFINTFGGAPASNCATAAESALDIFERIEGNGAGTYGTAATPGGNIRGLYTAGTAPNPTGTGLIPAPTNLFCQTSVSAPADNGGGIPQNTWRFTGRIDHHFTDRTNLTGRYAYENARLPNGAVSLSPYGNFFNTGQRARNQNLNLTLTHTFSSRLFSESRFVYNRSLFDQPEAGPGQAPNTTPCWQYLNGASTTTGALIAFPGYNPSVCAFAGIPFGGPQNIYQSNENMTFLTGKHTFKWGGGYLHMRDNRTFGAYENGFERSNTMQNMLNGIVNRIQIAIDPRGHTPDLPNPDSFYSITNDGPLKFPSFTRHFQYNEIATYVEDSYKATSKLTVTAGLRWEYFGVLHSPDRERNLDANLYLDAVGTVPPLVGSKTVFESVRDARFRRTNNFYKQDWKNFGPRVGIAYDLFGNGRTVFRGGYGIFWDRNFGNAVFNAIQNPPNYAVIVANPATFGVTATIDPNEFNTVAQLSGGTTVCPTGVAPPCIAIRSSARMLNNNLRTAYTEQWNATLEHDILGKGVVASLSYVGANGIGLYSLNNLNPIGGCVRDPAALTAVGLTCNPASQGSASRLNQTGLSGMNRRGNEGLSRYNSMQLSLRTKEISNTGVTLNANYTWAHSIDNESSFFADSAFDSNGGFGFRDAYNPALDRSNSSNDIRHRFTANVIWAVPWGKKYHGIAGQALGGWALTSIVTAETGGTFSVYDGSSTADCAGADGTNFCYSVQTAPGVPHATNIPVPGVPNTFTLYTINNLQTQDDFCSSANVTGQTGVPCSAILNQLFPTLLGAPHQFRLPGFYNWDAALLKDFKLPREGMGVQFRAEFFNVLNHSNLYAIASGSNSFVGTGTTIQASRGCLPTTGSPCTGGVERRNIQLALKFIF